MNRKVDIRCDQLKSTIKDKEVLWHLKTGLVLKALRSRFNLQRYSIHECFLILCATLKCWAL